MFSKIRPQSTPRVGLPFVLLCCLMAVIWLAGGASQASVLGQSIVRLAAWLCVIVMALFSRRRMARDVLPVGWFLLAALLLVVLQLIPLPPTLWSSLPGRAEFLEAAAAAGQAQPWRPTSIVPAMTFNAAFSLIVPTTILLLIASLVERERQRLVVLVLGITVASMLLGLLQFAGAGLVNPLINNSASQVSSNFANRNHFALFLAFGCLVAPAWAFEVERPPIGRLILGFGLIPLFIMTILASGSRAGLILAALAVVIGLAMVKSEIGKTLRQCPAWVARAISGVALSLVVLAALLSSATGRVGSLSRAYSGGADNDLRLKALPTVWSMTKFYFPVGTGLGTFDPVYRRHEPFALLITTYFNHAHNDALEVVIDAGLPGLLLLVAGLVWWLWASIHAWRPAPGQDNRHRRLGSSILLLVFVASIFDYPARTPMMMVVIIIAAVWLAAPAPQRVTRRRQTLPSDGQPL